MRIAFVCVHNSCRSQIAEALGKIFLGDACECLSAGTEPAAEINRDAVRLVKDLYGVDMTESQRPKLVSELPAVDVVVTMGCGVECPYLPCKARLDWGMDDPTGKGDEEFLRVIRAIEGKLLELGKALEAGWPDKAE
jgi:arsenate reductase